MCVVHTYKSVCNREDLFLEPSISRPQTQSPFHARDLIPLMGLGLVLLLVFGVQLNKLGISSAMIMLIDDRYLADRIVGLVLLYFTFSLFS
jgi:hypothetical protein